MVMLILNVYDYVVVWCVYDDVMVCVVFDVGYDEDMCMVDVKIVLLIVVIGVVCVVYVVMMMNDVM